MISFLSLSCLATLRFAFFSWARTYLQVSIFLAWSRWEINMILDKIALIMNFSCILEMYILIENISIRLERLGALVPSIFICRAEGSKLCWDKLHFYW